MPKFGEGIAIGLLAGFLLALLSPSSRRREEKDYSQSPSYTASGLSFGKMLGKKETADSAEENDDYYEKKICYFDPLFW